MQIFVRRPGAAPVALDVQPTLAASELMANLVPDVHHASEFYLSHGGKLLGNASLAEYGIQDLGVVDLGIRIRGGGGDGGATGSESRDCYLHMYDEKKPDKVDPNEARIAKWTRCALSSESLKPPCVADQLGSIYNKEAILAAISNKSLPKKLRYIKWKELVDIKLSVLPGVDAGDDYVETKYQCPVTGQEFNGKFKFVALKGCGHVLSARAFKEIRSKACLVCHADFNEEDKLPLNGTDEEVAVLREKMINRIKGKKLKNGAVAAVNSDVKIDVANGVENLQDTGLKRKDADEMPIPVASKKVKPLPVPVHAKSDVYKSIFTSSGKAKDIRETYSCRALPIGRN